jgi:hypothetical protein
VRYILKLTHYHLRADWQPVLGRVNNPPRDGILPDAQLPFG